MKKRKLLAIAVSATVVGTLGVLGITSASAATLDPTLPPGGNFNLSIWQLQLPTGSPGKPDTIQPAQLKGANGYSNPAYFWTDKNDGSMTFWAPEKGVTTPNSTYARSELREMNVYLGTENSPAGGQTLHKVGNVALGVKWTYVINVTGNKINLTVNGSKTSYTIPSSFNPYKEYFKAGSYNQSSSESTTNGAKVKFYALTVTHS